MGVTVSFGDGKRILLVIVVRRFLFRGLGVIHENGVDEIANETDRARYPLLSIDHPLPVSIEKTHRIEHVGLRFHEHLCHIQHKYVDRANGTECEIPHPAFVLLFHSCVDLLPSTLAYRKPTVSARDA